MAKDIKRKITLQIDAEIKQLQTALDNISKTSKNAFSSKYITELERTITNLTTRIEKVQTQLGGGLINQQELKRVEKEINSISSGVLNLTNKIKLAKKDSKVLEKLIPDNAKQQIDNATKELNKLGREIKTLESNISKNNSSYEEAIQKVEEYNKALELAQTKGSEKDKQNYNAFVEISKNIEKKQKLIDKLTSEMSANEAIYKENKPNGNYKNTKDYKNQNAQLKEQVAIINELKVRAEQIENIIGKDLFNAYKIVNQEASKQDKYNSIIQNQIESYKQLNDSVEKQVLLQKENENTVAIFAQKTKESLDSLNTDFTQATDAVRKMETTLDQTSKQAEEFARMAAEIDNVRRQVLSFLSVSNGIEVFRRSVTNAFDAVKQLDAAMTETAVVTDFTVSDMWEQLPQYTKMANELGVTTLGAYETMTLFYQQGLQTNEVMEVGTETMKMARIANLDYATATDYMTAALRGFNMEIDAINAQKVNDVYSELAAITAADTQEIAVAMTKTASIANSANMEFETTAAFLSQIVETTRESAETAGTALKTVIARFTELAKDPNAITEIDGEEVDANKIDAALKSVGVSLMDAQGQFRELDDVFLELASKWDILDTNTQRYIATVAAGSRQQSRFLAMMSDYDRTLELVNAAYDSTGASQAQFEKTLDSLDSKLNQLKNAWDAFAMGIMDDEAIKLGVDLFTQLLNTINNLTNSFGGLGGSLAKAGVIFGSLMLGKQAFKIGVNMASQLEKGLVDKFTSAKIGGKLATELNKEVKDLNLSDIINSKDNIFAEEIFKRNSQNLSNQISNIYDEAFKGLDTKININEILGQGFDNIDDYNNKMKLLNNHIDETFGPVNQQQVEEFRNRFNQLNITLGDTDNKTKSMSKSMNIATGVLMGTSVALSLMSNNMEDITPEFEGMTSAVNSSLLTLSSLNGIVSMLGITLTGPLMFGIGAVTAGIGLLSGVVTYYNKKEEEELKILDEKIQKGKDNVENLENQKNAYDKFNEALDKQNKNFAASEDLKSALNEVIDTYDLELNSVELLNKSYDELNRTIKDNIKQRLKQQLAEAKEAKKAQEEKYQKEKKNVGMVLGATDSIDAKIYQDLFNKGLVTRSSQSTVGSTSMTSFSIIEENLNKWTEEDIANFEKLGINVDGYIEAIKHNQSLLEENSARQEEINQILSANIINNGNPFEGIYDLETYQRVRQEQLNSYIKQGGTEEGFNSFAAEYGTTNERYYQNALQAQNVVNSNMALDENAKAGLSALIINYLNNGFGDLLGTLDFTQITDDKSFAAETKAKLGEVFLARIESANAAIEETLAEVAENGNTFVGLSSETQNNLIGSLSQLPAILGSAANAGQEFQMMLNSSNGDLEKFAYLADVAAMGTSKIQLGMNEVTGLTTGLSEMTSEMENLTKAVVSQGNAYYEAMSYIGEGGVVAYENLERFRQIMPELMVGAENLAEGNVRINASLLDSYNQLYEGIITGDKEATKAALESMIIESEANLNNLQTQLSILESLYEAEKANTDSSVQLSEDQATALATAAYLTAEEEINASNTSTQAQVDNFSQTNDAASTFGESMITLGDISGDLATTVSSNLKSINDNLKETTKSAVALAKAMAGDKNALGSTGNVKLTSGAGMNNRDFSEIEKFEEKMADTLSSDQISEKMDAINKEYNKLGEENRLAIIQNAINSIKNQIGAETNNISSLRQQIADLEAIGTEFKNPIDSGKSGSSKTEEIKEWINEFDKLYNLLEDISEEQRTINKLQDEYNDILKDSDKGITDLIENIKKQETILQSTLAKQQELLKGRKSEMVDALANNGDLSKYGTYNWADNTIEINWEEINKVKDEELGGRIEDYISKLENIQKEIETVEDDIEDTNKTLEELRDIGKEEYLDFEEKVKDALLQTYQDQIDAYQKISDSIANANSKLIEGINQIITQERQDRQNAKTEEDIAEKERRLAYLRQDTSGANQLEIMRLEKELSDTKESYTDTLIDQKISELQVQNDQAQAAREQQIQLMQAQLDWANANGQLWTETNKIISEGLSPMGTLVKGTELEKLLQTTDGWKGMSDTAKVEWLNSTNDMLEQALAYLSNSQQLEKKGITSGSISFTDASGKVVTGTVQSDGSVLVRGEGGSYRYTEVFQGLDGKYHTYENSGKFEADKPVAPPVNNNTSTGSNTPAPTPKPSLTKGSYVEVKPGTKWYYDSYGAKPTGRAHSGVIRYTNSRGSYPYNIEGLGWIKKTDIVGYKTGGIADFTGPAWLDGTKSKPEIILNQQDTQNFIALKDILRDVMKNNQNGISNGDTYYNIEINVSELSNGYDVNNMFNDIEQYINNSSNYRNVTAINIKK